MLISAFFLELIEVSRETRANLATSRHVSRETRRKVANNLERFHVKQESVEDTHTRVANYLQSISRPFSQ
jgi:hypothetical protein